MSRLEQYLNTRRDRFDRLLEAMKQYEAAQPSYAAQSGFYGMQLLSLAADDNESTEDLLRMFRRAVANTQQPA